MRSTELVTKNSKAIGLSEKQLNNYFVSSAYTSDKFMYTYLNQSYKGLPVYNQMIVLSSKEGVLLSNSGSFIDNIEGLVSASSTIPSISAKSAVIKALASEKVSDIGLGLNKSLTNNKFNFGIIASVTEELKGELIWKPTEKDGKLSSVDLVWNITVAPKGTDDIWSIMVDANSGEVVYKHNHTISDNFGIEEAKNPQAKIERAKYLEEKQAEKLNSPSIVANASYLVIPYPAESPIHPGGTAAVRNNPWTAAPGNASTLGWHSDGTNDYNTTRGNNVWATEDQAASNQNTGPSPISPTSPDLTFNYPPNYTTDPRNTAFQNFASTNLFYWINILHDITYVYGFDEPAGNFQKNNQGRGGNGGDDVLALSQSGAAGSIGNNANFSTPPDGGRGRMRMYLWDAPTTSLVHTNAPTVNDYPAVEGAFSTANQLLTVGPVTGNVALFNDAIGVGGLACSGAPSNNIAGKIAIINRGDCSFVIKILEAQNAGAIGVIMINNVAGAPIIMGGTDNTITIPAVMVSLPNGAALSALVNSGLNVTLSTTLGIPLDGDLDNGIITHELGHGISNRLTGGPATTSCLGNAEQGGEGWSDYFGLMMTTNWATATLNDGPIARGIGNYATAQPALTGVGIRSRPYSTNLTINPITYANMATPFTGITQGGVHYNGEIWCSAVWDMTWGIIAQENSINPNLYNFNTTTTNGGNSISLKLVLEGLKLQPCSPGYVDARNAVLAADRNLYAGRHACTIWTAFAKRGLGFGASQGSANSSLDQTSSTTLPPAPAITLQPMDASVAAGSNAVFQCSAGTDVNTIYRWEVSTNGGTTWAPVSPAVITPTLTLSSVTGAMNNNKYRCVAFIGCATTISAVANLTVTGGIVPPSITMNPANAVACAGTNVTYTAAASNATSFNWQVSTNGGTTWANVTPANTTSTLTLTAVTTAMSTNQYRMVATNGSGSVNTTAATLTVNAAPTAPTVSGAATYCQGATALPLTATGTGLLWYTSSTGGTGSGTAPTVSTASAGATTYYVSQTVSGCESPRASITITITATPAAPTATSPVAYCQGATATALTATGTGLLWYPSAAGGAGSATAPTPSTTALGTTNYYVSQTISGCESPRLLLAVNITATPAAPTISTPISYCQGVTANPLTATGTGLLWYTASTGGTGSATAPTPSTLAVGSTTYYVSQSTGCESPRVAIVVNIVPGTAAPTVVTPLAYCQGATAAVLTATGTGLLWYTSATGGAGTTTAPPVSTATAGTVTYYVSQTSGACESPRAAIVVNTTATPAAPIVTTPVNYCQGATAAALTATGTNLKWYTVPTAGTALASAPTPLTTALGSTTYYVSQTTGTCEGPRASIIVTISAVPSAPIATSPVTYCQGATSVALTATGTGLLWYTTATGGAGSASAPTPSTATVGSTTYYVSQTTTCESVRTPIVVNITTTSAAPTVTSPINYCQGNTATQLTATGTGLLWYTVAAGGTGSATAPTPSTATAGSVTYYVSQTTGSCESPRTAIVVNVGSAPAITAQPVDITSCTTTATFTATASGTNLTYQWQVSTDGGLTYTNIASATASSLTLTGLTSAQANNKYRLVVSSASCPTATSVAVTARVGNPPVVVLTAAPTTNFNPSVNGALVTTVSPPGNYTYTWKRNNVTIANTSTSLTKANGLLEDFGSYVVTVTDVASGCFGVSNAITTNNIDSEIDRLFVGPNPTNGIIRVSYYSPTNTSQSRTLAVYDAKGARLMFKQFTLTGRYGSADIDLSRFVGGNYSIVLLDGAGKKLASEIVVKY
jgi:hypothetical protein